MPLRGNSRFGLRHKRKPDGERRCYHHIGMKPHSIGRTLGIGLRVAGRMAGQHIAAGAAAPAESAAPASAPGNGPDSRARGRAAGQATVRGSAGVARGVGGFLRPFRRVGGILWLEVTGVFFLLFVVAFAPVLWRTRASWAHGADHRTFVVSAAIVVVFLYLSVSSFWRARRK
jgi:hypothetical protein